MSFISKKALIQDAVTLSVSTQDIEMIIPYHVFEATKQAIYERNLFIIQRKDNSTPSKKEVCAKTALTRTGLLVPLWVTTTKLHVLSHRQLRISHQLQGLIKIIGLRNKWPSQKQPPFHHTDKNKSKSPTRLNISTSCSQIRRHVVVIDINLHWIDTEKKVVDCKYLRISSSCSYCGNLNI